MNTNEYLPSPEELLDLRAAEYAPRIVPLPFVIGRLRPPFAFWTIDAMLADSKINYGLWLLRGPILTRAEFEIEAEDEVQEAFIKDQVDRFWSVGAPIALEAFEWGYSGSEVIYVR